MAGDLDYGVKDEIMIFDVGHPEGASAGCSKPPEGPWQGRSQNKYVVK